MAINSQKLPLVAIVGRANVGKSTLFNRLVGTRQAITHDLAGTTRDSVYAPVEWGKHNFILVDTAGFKTSENALDIATAEQIESVAGAADLILVVVDAGNIITTEDRQAAKLALKTGRPVVLALNKIDTAAKGLADEFKKLGIKTIVEVSAVHGRGSGDLLDAIGAQVKAHAAAPIDNTITIALLGRPNVGKSSIMNSLAGKSRAIVSDRAGTTRDVKSIELKYKTQAIRILDTAGLRRSGKIEAGIEKFSTLRTIAAIAEADICVLIMDGTEPSVAGDQHIAGMVLEAGKGLILDLNKWDAVEKDDKTQALLARKIQGDFQFAAWTPLIFTSAETGLHVNQLLELATQIHARRLTEVPTPKLNKFIERIVSKQPPAGLKNRQPKIKYATQIGVSPPTFALFATHAKFIHFSYKRYVENNLRQEYDFIGTPIKLEWRDSRVDEKK